MFSLPQFLPLLGFWRVRSALPACLVTAPFWALLPGSGHPSPAHHAPPAAGPGCYFPPRCCTHRCMCRPGPAGTVPGTAAAPQLTPAPGCSPPLARADLDAARKKPLVLPPRMFVLPSSHPGQLLLTPSGVRFHSTSTKKSSLDAKAAPGSPSELPAPPGFSSPHICLQISVPSESQPGLALQEGRPCLTPSLGSLGAPWGLTHSWAQRRLLNDPSV